MLDSLQADALRAIECLDRLPGASMLPSTSLFSQARECLAQAFLASSFSLAGHT